MSTITYLKRMIDMLDSRIEGLEQELRDYRWSKHIDILANSVIPEHQVYTLSSFPFSVGQYLEIDKEYFRVKEVDRTAGTWKMERVRT